MLNVERIVHESKKLETLLALKRGLTHPSYDTLLKLEAIGPINREFGLNDYFILTRDLKSALIEAVTKKIEIESKRIESLINEGRELQIKQTTNVSEPSATEVQYPQP